MFKNTAVFLKSADYLHGKRSIEPNAIRNGHWSTSEHWIPSNRSPFHPLQIRSVSNLCGCRVGVPAAGGCSDAVSLEDLLGVLQHGLVAKLQVELETQKREFALFVCFQYKPFKLSIKLAIKHKCIKQGMRPICEVLELSVSHLLLQHVLPLLPHLFHQQR